MYLAEDLKQGESAPDEDEFLEVHEATLQEVKRYMSEGWISDAKTMLGVYIWELASHTGRFGHE
ncbi:hypothetical protein D3C81_1514000 [compost metagenome]